MHDDPGTLPSQLTHRNKRYLFSKFEFSFLLDRPKQKLGLRVSMQLGGESFRFWIEPSPFGQERQVYIGLCNGMVDTYEGLVKILVI